MTALDTTRASVHALLVPLLPAGRVHLYPPPQLVAPTIWIDQPSGSVDESIVTTEFPIHLVAGGAPDAQCRILDRLLGTAWDALTKGGYQPSSWRADYVDTGVTDDSFQRYVLTVPALLGVSTFCGPDQFTVPVWPEPALP